jgi:hypothetical protein
MTDEELDWLRTEFARCRPWLEAALAHDIGTHSIDDVRADIESGRAQLWPGVNAAMVTNIETYPHAKVCRGWLSGGDLAEIVATEPKVRDWATRQGCGAVMIVGRRGWARVFPGYRETHAIVTRML